MNKYPPGIAARNNTSFSHCPLFSMILIFCVTSAFGECANEKIGARARINMTGKALRQTNVGILYEKIGKMKD